MSSHVDDLNTGNKVLTEKTSQKGYRNQKLRMDLTVFKLFIGGIST